MDEVNRLWNAYNQYKEEAQPYEFAYLVVLDMQLIPKYNDLKENYTEEHAEIFKRAMRKVLNHLGVRLEEQEDETDE